MRIHKSSEAGILPTDMQGATSGAAQGATTISEQIERRRSAVASRWNLGDELILIGAGGQIAVPGRADHAYPYRPHSEYFYLTDRTGPDGVLAFERASGWTQFVRPLSASELLWSTPAVDELELDGRPIDELEHWLSRRPKSRIAWLGQRPSDANSDLELESQCRLELNHVRRQKDAVELDRMRQAERATHAGFELVVALIGAGVSERELQIELEAAFFRAGADTVAFNTIVASGPNTAVLHATPGARRLQDGELLLIDAGGEYRGYDSDVTRTFTASGRWEGMQNEIRAIVNAARIAAIQSCRPGVEWRDVHVGAMRIVADGLASLGVLRGSPEGLIEGGTVRLFFPHGIGHMVGLGVRDAGEVLPGRPAEFPGLPPLRVNLPLLAGHVVTIEPGIYFVPPILNDRRTREQHRETVAWDTVDALLGFGGIRIEDNVLVTDSGPEVLTKSIPVNA